MGQQREVNETQRSVLTWIADGCPDGVMTGHTYKTTAVALQTRGLVIVSKKRGVWSAALTDEGRYFIEHGDYPPRPETTTDGGTAGRPVSTRAADPGRDPCTPTTSTATRPRRATARKPVAPTALDAAAFLEQLVADGGTRSVRGSDTETLALVKAAHQHGLVPESKLLTIDGTRHHTTRHITLTEKPHWMTAVLDPIPVAESLRKPHPAIAALKADKTRLAFQTQTRGRALRLLDALAKTARERGYQAAIPPADPRRRSSDLTIEIDSHRFGLRITEQTDRTPHAPTPRELEEAARPWGRKPPRYDHHPSGRLTITIEDGITVRQENFADTKTIDLADRLPNVLQEVELRAEADEQRRLERERRDAERRRAWETARARAVIAHAEHHRAQTLNRQLIDWQRSRDLHAYLHAVRAHIDTLPVDQQEPALAWHTWATNHAESLNPLGRPLGMPHVPEPYARDLQDFMPPGLSIYGPWSG